MLLERSTRQQKPNCVRTRICVLPSKPGLQHHLDQALEAWIAYDEPILAARTWCLKGSCSGAAGDFTVAASSFKRAQQLAEEAGDAQLVLCVMLNRAICEVRIGDPTAAAACSRRAFVKAEAEHDPAMILVAHCVRCVNRPPRPMWWPKVTSYPSRDVALTQKPSN